MASDDDHAHLHHGLGEASKSIYVGNVPHKTTGSEIIDCFSKFGPIDSISPGVFSRVSKGYAFVNFRHVESAIQAAQAVAGMFPFGQSEKGILINFTQPRHAKDSSGRSNREYGHPADRGDHADQRDQRDQRYQRAQRAHRDHEDREYDWFESQNTAPMPQRPRSIIRDISPPMVKRRTASTKVQAFPRNHNHNNFRRPTYSHSAPKSPPGGHGKGNGPYDTSPSARHKAKYSLPFSSDKGPSYTGRKNEHEDNEDDEAIEDQQERDEIETLKRLAMPLRSSTNGRPKSSPWPAQTTRMNDDGAEISRRAGEPRPLREDSAEPRQSAESALHQADGRHQQSYGSPSAFYQGVPLVCDHYSPNHKERAPLTPASQTHSDKQAEARAGSRERSSELGNFPHRARQDCVSGARSLPRHTARSPSLTGAGAIDSPVQSEGAPLDWIDDGSDYPLQSSPSLARRAEAAHVARLYKKITCPLWSERACKYTPNPGQCLFSHHETGIYVRAPHLPESARGFTCPDWFRSGSCRTPDSCGYAHSDTGRYMSEFNNKPSTRHLTCTFWYRGNQCKYAEHNCLFAHHDTGQYGAGVPFRPRDSFRDAELDRGLAGVGHAPIQRRASSSTSSSMSPTSPSAFRLRDGHTSFDQDEGGMRPPSATTPFTEANNKRALPHSDYFGPDPCSRSGGPSESKALYILGGNIPHSPQLTTSTANSCRRDSVTAHSVAEGVSDLQQSQTKAGPEQEAHSINDDSCCSTKPAQTSDINPVPEAQPNTPTVESIHSDRTTMPNDQSSVKIGAEKHFARPSRVLLNPRRRRRQSLAASTSSRSDLNTGAAQSSSATPPPAPLALCQACGKKLFGSGEHCSACSDKVAELVSLAAAKMPTPVQSPTTLDGDQSIVLDGFHIPQQRAASKSPEDWLVDEPTGSSSATAINTSTATSTTTTAAAAEIEASEDSTLQSELANTPPAKQKLPVKAVPAKRSASGTSPFISKKQAYSTPWLRLDTTKTDGIKSKFTSLRERSKPKPSLEDLTREALRRNSEAHAETTVLPQQAKNVNIAFSAPSTSTHRANQGIQLPSVEPQDDEDRPHRQAHDPEHVDREEVGADVECVDNVVPTTPTQKPPKALQEIFSKTTIPSPEPVTVSPTIPDASNALLSSTSPATREQQDDQSCVDNQSQNQGKRRREDEDDDDDDDDDDDGKPLRRLRKRTLQQGEDIFQVSISEVEVEAEIEAKVQVEVEVRLEETEHVPQELDDQVIQPYYTSSTDGDTESAALADEHCLHGEAVERLATPPGQTPALAAPADDGFDEAAYLARLRAKGAIIEDDSDDEEDEEEADREMSDVRAKVRYERSSHFGAVPVKVSRDLFAVAPSLKSSRPTAEPGMPRYQLASQQSRPGKKELWKNLLAYQCNYRKRRFGKPHQVIDEIPQRRICVATVLESAPQMMAANGVDGRPPSIFDVAPVVEEKRKMTTSEFLGAPKDPVILRDGPKGNLVVVDGGQLQNKTLGRRVTVEKFPFVEGD